MFFDQYTCFATFIDQYTFFGLGATQMFLFATAVIFAIVFICGFDLRPLHFIAAFSCLLRSALSSHFVSTLLTLSLRRQTFYLIDVCYTARVAFVLGPSFCLEKKQWRAFIAGSMWVADTATNVFSGGQRTPPNGSFGRWCKVVAPRLWLLACVKTKAWASWYVLSLCRRVHLWCTQARVMSPSAPRPEGWVSYTD